MRHLRPQASRDELRGKLHDNTMRLFAETTMRIPMMDEAADAEFQNPAPPRPTAMSAQLLREELEQRELPITGKKAELVKRVTNARVKESGGATAAAPDRALALLYSVSLSGMSQNTV